MWLTIPGGNCVYVDFPGELIYISYGYISKESISIQHKAMYPALVQIMACRLVGAKPLSEPMLASPSCSLNVRLHFQTLLHIRSHISHQGAAYMA